MSMLFSDDCDDGGYRIFKEYMVRYILEEQKAHPLHSSSPIDALYPHQVKENKRQMDLEDHKPYDLNSPEFDKIMKSTEGLRAEIAEVSSKISRWLHEKDEKDIIAHFVAHSKKKDLQRWMKMLAAAIVEIDHNTGISVCSRCGTPVSNLPGLWRHAKFGFEHRCDDAILDGWYMTVPKEFYLSGMCSPRPADDAVKFDPGVCSCCGVEVDPSDGGWRYNGRDYEHHCPGVGQAGHFPAIKKSEYEKSKGAPKPPKDDEISKAEVTLRMSEAKNCPKCSGRPDLEWEVNMYDRVRAYRVFCNKCDYGAPQATTPHDAVYRWNNMEKIASGEIKIPSWQDERGAYGVAERATKEEGKICFHDPSC